MTIIEKIVLGIEITDQEIYDGLYEICDKVHSFCDDECPVFRLNKGAVGTDKPFKENRGCDCFKNGKAMAEFIKSR